MNSVLRRLFEKKNYSFKVKKKKKISTLSNKKKKNHTSTIVNLGDFSLPKTRTTLKINANTCICSGSSCCFESTCLSPSAKFFINMQVLEHDELRFSD